MKSSYRTLALVLSINAVVMLLLTYAMIDQFSHFYLNINRAYMALLMVSPMAIMMLVFMASMFLNDKLNKILISVFTGIFIFIFLCMRTQYPVGNKQFLRSMIPHHSGAILMCERSSINDPEIIELCGYIVETQKKEIAQMKKILERY